MSVYSNPSRPQFPRSNVTGKVPELGQPGSLAVNWRDRKLWTFLADGTPLAVSQRPEPFDPTRVYFENDLAIQNGAMVRATQDVGAGGFNPAVWERLTGEEQLTGVQPFSSSLLSGGAIAQTGTNSIQVAAGRGIVVDAEDPRDITGSEVQWSTFGVNVSAGGETARALVINSSGSMLSVTLTQFQEQRPFYISLGFALFDDAGEIVGILQRPSISGRVAEDVRDMHAAQGGAYRIDGVELEPQAMQIAVSSGRTFALGWRRASNPTNPNIVPVAAQDPIAFDVLRSNGEVVAGSADSVDPTLWESGTLSGSEAAIHYLFATPDLDRIWVQLGQTVYDTLSAAVGNLSRDYAEFTPVYEAGAFSLLLGAIIVRADATDLADTDQAFVAGVGAGPAAAPRFLLESGEGSFLPLDGAQAMTGNLNMGGNEIENAVIDEGAF